MTTKRIVLIILCVLLAVMIVLFALVGSRFVPLLSLLTGGPGQTDTTTEPSTVSPSTGEPPQQTTAPTDPSSPTTVPTEPTQPRPTEPGHEHEYTVSKVVEAVCGTPGYTVYKCDCGKTDIRDIVDAVSHTYDTGTKVVATCEEQGYTEFECINCGYIDRRNYSDPIGHDYVLVETMTPSCVQDGYEWYKCGNCEDEKKENEVIAPGHVCEEWVETIPPGPNQPGEDRAVCAVCGEIVTQPCQLQIRSRFESTHDTFWSYTVYVGTVDTNKAIEYIIHDYSRASISFEYREDGLAVFRNGMELTTLAAYQNVTLTIDADGNIVSGDPVQPPVPTEPTVPIQPTDPSERSDPSTPADEGNE